ncbi:energy transducer TonB [Sphingomonas sp. ID0503]|uniref:energy transducer TonB n=1 Tax=Sphingomonas sp. ID0503 TaxID=3399691 RepID=UPI003AFB68C4
MIARQQLIWNAVFGTAALVAAVALLIDSRRSALPLEVPRVAVEVEAQNAAPALAVSRAVPDQCGNGRLTASDGPISPARAATPQGSWITSEDYPASALQAEQRGVVLARFTVLPEGSIANCTIEQSSGVPVLDRATCTALVRSARYVPATDEAGCPVSSEKRQRVRWELPA